MAIDVRGYFHFSALDNYEWGTFTPTFGLIAWDPITFERRPKPSLAWFGRTGRMRAGSDGRSFRYWVVDDGVMEDAEQFVETIR